MFRNIRFFLLLIAFLVSTSLAAARPDVRISICRIQGSGFSSPYQGHTVQVEGIVTADFDGTPQQGFYLQKQNCDLNPSTSNGIFIYSGERLDVVSTGDRVEVDGMVQEYYGMTEIAATPSDVTVLTHGNPLPTIQELNPPSPNAEARSYFETLEGMLVSFSQGVVVGPTSTDDHTWLVHRGLGIDRVFYDDPQGTGEVVCIDDGGNFEIVPEAKVGDTVRALAGVLDFRLGEYCIQLTASPEILSAAHSRLPEGSMVTTGMIDVATYNLADLFDTVDDPLTEDQHLSGFEYQRRLQKRALTIASDLNHPAILGVQEAENLDVLQDLIARPEIQAGYQIVHQDGPDVRGLDIALLFRADLVNLIGYEFHQGCTSLVDGFEPDGNGDPQNPQNYLTCDRDGDGLLDGNRLFSRPPLVAHFWARPRESSSISANFYDLWVITCHFKSKVEDSSTTPYTLPRRIEQAQFVASLAQQIQQSQPLSTLIILGDLNDHSDSQPLAALRSTGLVNAMDFHTRSSRYTYINHGISQTLDYVLYSPQPFLIPAVIQPVHINADFPDFWFGENNTSRRSSDHDPLLVGFTPAFPAAFLPVIAR